MTLNASQTLDRQFLEMRWRLLSLAADFDRIQRSPGGEDVLARDPRIQQLRTAAKLLTGDELNRAEKLQMIFSDLMANPQ